MTVVLLLVVCALSLFSGARGARGAPHVEPRADTKYVFAHHIVGNTYVYNRSTWMTDIMLAKSAGIDGFALNVGPDPWQLDRVADACVEGISYGGDKWYSRSARYAVANTTNGGFKLFISVDMRYIISTNRTISALIHTSVYQPCDKPENATALRNWVTTYSNNSAQFMYKNKVSTLPNHILD